MSTTHEILAPVQVIPCFGIYADYDAEAPDTASLFLVATEALAEECLAKLNEDPRRCLHLHLYGWEWKKSFAWRREFVSLELKGEICVSVEDAWTKHEIEAEEDDKEGE